MEMGEGRAMSPADFAARDLADSVELYGLPARDYDLW
jgi:hypothetical protein